MAIYHRKNLMPLCLNSSKNCPHDVINGQPFHYRRTEDGQFILYSVGWNEKDDDGQVVLTKNGFADREKGDWVPQRYPAQ